MTRIVATIVLLWFASGHAAGQTIRSIIKLLVNRTERTIVKSTAIEARVVARENFVDGLYDEMMLQLERNGHSSEAAIFEVELRKGEALLANANRIYDIHQNWLPLLSSLNASSDMEILVSLPRSEIEFANIFGAHNQNNIDITMDLSHRVANFNRIVRISSASDFLNRLQSASKKLLVIIGHNDHGEFIFPDGSYINLAELSALTPGRPVVILSCNSVKYTDKIGVNFSLSYRDAFEIADEINSTMLNSSFSEELIKRIIYAKQTSNNLITLQKVIFKTAAVGSGVGIYIVLSKQSGESHLFKTR